MDSTREIKITLPEGIEIAEIIEHLEANTSQKHNEHGRRFNFYLYKDEEIIVEVD
jgi:hypothetical protein